MHSIDVATVEVRLKNSTPVQVVARMKILVLPEMPTTHLKYYFVTDSRFLEEVTGDGTMHGTKIRDGLGGTGSMSAEADEVFSQIAAHMALSEPTESRDIPFLGPPDYYDDPTNHTGPHWTKDQISPAERELIDTFFP